MPTRRTGTVAPRGFRTFHLRRRCCRCSCPGGEYAQGSGSNLVSLYTIDMPGSTDDAFDVPHVAFDVPHVATAAGTLPRAVDFRLNGVEQSSEVLPQLFEVENKICVSYPQAIFNDAIHCPCFFV